MSSTNHTTNYNLSQFLGSDKPAWLSDYNGDMGKIDTAIKNAADTANVADGKGDTAATNIGTLSNLTTTVKTNLVAAINEVDGNADTAQNTADAAGTKAIANETRIGQLEAYLDITSFVTYTSGDNKLTLDSGGTLASGSSVTVARNVGGTLGKVYGTITMTASTTGNKTMHVAYDTGLRPTEAITISPAGMCLTPGFGMHSASIKINTDGTLEISAYVDQGNCNIFLTPSLYFMKNFGDVA